MIRNNRTPVCEFAAAGETPPQSIPVRAQITLAACACGGSATFLFLVDPNRYAVYPPCLLYQMTGIYCAGCGATRALHALLHGNLMAALHDNVLLTCALPVLAWMALPRLAQAWRENRWPEIRLEGRYLARIALWVVVVAAGFMALRNLPGWPFELLRPI
ncbi:MAG TPA: DUF2752 domain-containing protein [Candidatus Methylacidiphilales bacterium]|nr:DUF2752 domain-containing protein [Candidatus Methylacidiphilales bacterium]